MTRKRFSGQGPYLSFEQARNAIRAEKINVWLDEGRRVFCDDGPDTEGTWHEIEEALEPLSQGIKVLTKDDKIVTIYSLDGTEERAQKFDKEQGK